MTKITSYQRRRNRFVRADEACGYIGCACGMFFSRWTVAYDRQTRRTARLIARGKITAKECRAIPCPPFQEVS